MKAIFLRITFAIAILLTVPVLIKEGMFMDALLYTTVSHNLAHGIGTFWFPQFSLHNLAGLTSFHEQPPLVFVIQSVFFRLLGDSMYVERFYVFLTMLINAFLIMKIWKLMNPDEKSRNLSWLPVLLWIIVPVCFWSFANNMHENTMSIFILAAVYCMCKEIIRQRSSFLYSFAAGLFIFLATLSKGIPGIFPIVVPILCYTIFRDKNFAGYFLQTIRIFLVFLVLYGFILLIPDARESLYTYLTKRALNRINELPTVGSRFYILGRIFSELIPHLILLLLYFSINGLSKIKTEIKPELKKAIFFLLIGFAGSVPLMLTMVQKGFYFVPSLPYFGIGFAFLFKNPVQRFIEYTSASQTRISKWNLYSYLLIFAAIVFSAMQTGKYSRDEILLKDIDIISKYVPDHSVLSVSTDLWNDWSLQCYMSRYHFISLEPLPKENFYLCTKTETNVSESYHEVRAELNSFRLYQK